MPAYDVQHGRYCYDARHNVVYDGDGNVCNGGEVDGVDHGRQGTMVFLELTRACNLSCEYCYQKINEFDSSLTSPKRNAVTCTHLIGTLDSVLSAAEDVLLVFYGGEPLVKYDAIKNLIEYCDRYILEQRCNIQYSITTNGVLFNDCSIQMFSENVVDVAISVHASANRKDGSRQLLQDNVGESIVKLASRGNPATLLYTLTKSAVAHFYDDINYLLQLPIKAIKFFPCDSFSDEYKLTVEESEDLAMVFENKVRELIEEKDYTRVKKIWNLISNMKQIDNGKVKSSYCQFGTKIFAISEKGELYSCPCFIGHRDYKMELGQHNGTCNALSKPEKCNKCVAHSLCGGGCHYSNYVESVSGRYEPAEAYCIIQRCFAKLAVRNYIDLYLCDE